MGKITLSRPQKVLLPFSKGKILIDGSERETVKAGKTVEFEVPDGHHDIQVLFAAVPPVNSNVVHFEQSGDDLAFEVKITVPVKGGDTFAELTMK